jgi:hypothetical protein
MSGKSIPLPASSQEISEAFKRTGLPIQQFGGFEVGFRLHEALANEQLLNNDLPITVDEVRP